MIQIKEMGPRDGLQNESKILSVQDKVAFIVMLEAAGLDYVEVGAFVREDKVPQMAGTADVLGLLKLNKNTTASVLVPNMCGWQKAVACQVQEIAVFTSASETFNQKNIHASIDESLKRFAPVMLQAQDKGVKVRGYISTAFVCPFEGEIDVEKVVPLIELLLEMGCYEVSIGDTIGKATKDQVQRLFQETRKLNLNASLAGHFHDTYGQALENIAASIQEGIAVFDASIAGLGGCPYAPGAPGNVATEKVLEMLDTQELARSPQINLEALKDTASWIQKKLRE